MKKINFKQLKYMIPIGIFPFLLMLGYQVLKFTNGEVEVKEETPNETQEVNTALPDVDVDKKGIKSKYQSMLDNYGKVTDRTGVVNIEKEEEREKGADIKSAYSDRERRLVDSLNAVRMKEQEKFREELNKLRQPSEYGKNQDGEKRVNIPDERIQDNPATAEEKYEERMMKQMELIQKMMNGEEVLTSEEQQRRERARELAEIKKQLLDSINQKQAPLEVTKANDANEEYFNSIKEGGERPGMIRARVDEVLKVKDGSRIRIRLSEDVEIDGEILPRGSCLYAIVDGFSAQRVRASVSQIMVNGHIRRVDLKVYDVDCIEGFYVPNNAFRDLMKDVGAGTMGTNINMNSTSGDTSVESVALEALQQAFQTTTQALSQHIRKNKAKIKFNTEIYLVNEKDIKE